MGNHTFTDHSGRKTKETQTDEETSSARHQHNALCSPRLRLRLHPHFYDTATHGRSTTGLLLPSARGIQVKQESISYLQRSEEQKTQNSVDCAFKYLGLIWRKVAATSQ
ncbi:uncharacterized protein ACO6RY_16078 [Pungitius sinensis]